MLILNSILWSVFVMTYIIVGAIAAAMFDCESMASTIFIFLLWPAVLALVLIVILVLAIHTVIEKTIHKLRRK